jgi:Signal transduction histidine kinase
MSDTGVGISEDDQARIFEPFFSTGKKGQVWVCGSPWTLFDNMVDELM